MSKKMAVRCPWCVKGEEMLYRERRTPGAGYGFAGRYECPVCGSRAPEIQNIGIDRADLKEAAYSAAMARWVEESRPTDAEREGEKWG